MRTSTLKFLLGLLILGLVPVMEACSDGPKTNTIDRRRNKKKKKTTVREVTEKQAVDLSRVPLRFRNIDWDSVDVLATTIRGSRDPFLPYVDDLRVKAEEDKKKNVTKIKTAVGDAEVGDLKLIAIITGTAVHKAMVEDGSGLGHILVSGNVVGRKPPMRVVRITRNEVIFKALEKPTDDKTKPLIRKVLRTQQELQELLP